MRPLKRKLTSTFVALGLTGLLVIGVTSYTVVQWRETEDALARHYTRSLRLQEVRALTFEAFKEVPDAIIGGDTDFRQDYERRLAPIGAAFGVWVQLAEDDEERAEVAAVRGAAEKLDASARGVFDLVDNGQRAQATADLERVEETAFEPFDAITTAAVERDRFKREQILASAAAARSRATLTLALAALGVVSLLLLVAAFLSGGVFRPIGRLHDALRRLHDGDTSVRLAEDGHDEVARVNRVYNALAASTALRSAPDSTPFEHPPPPKLHLVDVQPAAFVHEVLSRVSDDIVRRAVSTRVDVDPRIELLRVDRIRLREAVSELVQNGLDALPPRGGLLQVRLAPRADGWLALEVQDDGSGISEDDIAWLYDGSLRPADQRGTGLRLATTVVEQHGGRMQLQPGTDRGTTARALLPADRWESTTTRQGSTT